MKYFTIAILVLFLLGVGKSHAVGIPETTPPNLIFMLADDQGFNDIGYNNDRVLTPNMNELAESGVTLKYNYMQQECTPSRVALLTGMYPYHVGRQGSVIKSTQPTGLTLDRELLSNKLTDLGYDSHIVGKWHLGFCNEAYLPLSRGFASHYGYWEGAETFWTKEHHNFTDFHDGYDILLKEDYPEVYDTYSSYLYQDRVDSILDNYAAGSGAAPLFLYFPIQSPHDPLEAPQEYLDLYDPSEEFEIPQAIKDLLATKHLNIKEQRLIYKPMVTALDDVVGHVIQKLKDVGIYNNTIFVFSSDNGPDPRYNLLGARPLKGWKGDLNEGGVRVPGFIHSPLLANPGRVSESIVHATDWYPTFLRLAGESAEAVSALELDGVDQYNTFFAKVPGNPSPRTRIVHNIKVNDDYGIIEGAIRDGAWKYMREAVSPTEYTEVLYNIALDYKEIHDLSEKKATKTAEMSDLFDELSLSMVPANDVEGLDGDPHVDENGYVQSGWCDI